MNKTSPALEDCLSEINSLSMRLHMQAISLREQAEALEEYMYYVREGGDPSFEEFLKLHEKYQAGDSQTAALRVLVRNAARKVVDACFSL